MSSFAFQPVQFLDIKSEDNPQIDLNDGVLTIKANRGAERIVISAPINGLLASQVPTQTRVRRIDAPAKVSDPRSGTILPSSHGAVGENNPLSKLNAQIVREIRAMASDSKYRAGFKSKQAMLYDLSRVYNVHWTTIWSIINRRSWKHVTDQ